MKAKDIISPRSASAETLPQKVISADTALTDVLHRLLDTEDHRIGVADGQEMLGIIDADSLMEGLSHLITARNDSSTVVMEMAPSAYSASQIAGAVEDANVHLVDLWTAPGAPDTLRVTIRVQTTDPSGVVSSLERYGFDIVEATGEENRNMETAIERLLSLNAMLNV